MTAVGWSHDDSLLLSCASDGVIAQWRHVGGEPAGVDDAAAAAAAVAEEAALDSDVEAELRAQPRASPFASVDEAAAARRGGGGGAAPRGAAAAVGVPRATRRSRGAARRAHTRVGVRRAHRRRRSNVHWTAGGEIVFHAAALAVVYDPATHAQRFFTAHTDDVLCAAVHPGRLLAATGQAGVAPFACVWDTRTSEALSVLRGAHRLGVCAVAFDASGALLATAGLEPSHNVALWDWARGALVGRVACGPARLFALAFRPPAAADGAPAIELAACGVRALHFVSSGDTDAAAGGAARLPLPAWRVGRQECAVLAALRHLPAGRRRRRRVRDGVRARRAPALARPPAPPCGGCALEAPSSRWRSRPPPRGRAVGAAADVGGQGRQAAAMGWPVPPRGHHRHLSARSVMTGGRSPSPATHRRCARCRSTARAARR